MALPADEPCSNDDIEDAASGITTGGCGVNASLLEVWILAVTNFITSICPVDFDACNLTNGLQQDAVSIQPDNWGA